MLLNFLASKSEVYAGLITDDFTTQSYLLETTVRAKWHSEEE